MRRIPPITVLISNGQYEEARSKIRAAYKAHQKRPAVAAALGCSVQSLNNWIAKIVAVGLEDPRKGLSLAAVGRPAATHQLSALQKRQILRRVERGEPYSVIARDFDVADDTVGRLARAAGIAPGPGRKKSA